MLWARGKTFARSTSFKKGNMPIIIQKQWTFSITARFLHQDLPYSQLIVHDRISSSLIIAVALSPSFVIFIWYTNNRILKVSYIKVCSWWKGPKILPCQSSSFLTILVPLLFIIISLVFFLLSKLLFQVSFNLKIIFTWQLKTT